jgi:hypothetical protein
MIIDCIILFFFLPSFLPFFLPSFHPIYTHTLITPYHYHRGYIVSHFANDGFALLKGDRLSKNKKDKKDKKDKKGKKKKGKKQKKQEQ